MIRCIFVYQDKDAFLVALSMILWSDTQLCDENVNINLSTNISFEVIRTSTIEREQKSRKEKPTLNINKYRSTIDGSFSTNNKIKCFSFGEIKRTCYFARIFHLFLFLYISCAFVLMCNDHNFLYKNMYCHLLNGVSSSEKHQENDNTKKHSQSFVSL